MYTRSKSLITTAWVSWSQPQMVLGLLLRYWLVAARANSHWERAEVGWGFGICSLHFKAIIFQWRHHLRNNLPFTGIHFSSPPVQTAVGGNIFGKCFGLLTKEWNGNIINEGVNFAQAVLLVTSSWWEARCYLYSCRDTQKRAGQMMWLMSMKQVSSHYFCQ